MKWKTRGLPLKQSLLLAFTWCLFLSPSPGFSWTATRWLGVIEASAGTAALAPEITPSGDVCENCGGTGRLGDGVVSVECPVCDGTGKPKTPGLYSTNQACRSCGNTGTINISPTPPGMDAPAAKQEAATSGGGTYKRGLFRRR